MLSRSETREATRICQFVTNNHALFYLWLKGNLLNHEKVSNCYEHDCSLLSVMIKCIKYQLQKPSTQ